MSEYLKGILSLFHTYTPQFRNQQGKIIRNSVAEMTEVQLGGIKQSILIRGENIDNPILLFLNGGPGTPQVPSFRQYNKSLEKYFIVIYWDQRGFGKSYSKSVANSQMSIEQFVKDTHDLTKYLKERFNKKKIYLAGHSWGSVIGMINIYKYPEDFYAYIGVGQMVNFLLGEEIGYKRALDEAKKEGNKEAIKELNGIGIKGKAGYKIKFQNIEIQRKWLTYYGFVSRNPKFNIVKDGILSTEYTLLDMIKSYKGAYLQVKNRMVENELKNIDFFNTIPKVNVPIYFFLGKHDYTTPSILSSKYLEYIDAPKKKIVWFEKSAHMPCYTEADKFNKLIVDMVLDETYY